MSLSERVPTTHGCHRNLLKQGKQIKERKNIDKSSELQNTYRLLSRNERSIEGLLGRRFLHCEQQKTQYHSVE
jgi:hypothetical protein